MTNFVANINQNYAVFFKSVVNSLFPKQSYTFIKNNNNQIYLSNSCVREPTKDEITGAML